MSDNEQPEPPKFHEAHLLNYNNGHDLQHGPDCWCEPTIYWCEDAEGETLMVVEHTDYTRLNHNRIVRRRASSRDWITRVLETVPESTT